MSFRLYSLCIALLVLALASLVTLINLRLEGTSQPLEIASLSREPAPPLPMAGSPTDVAASPPASISLQQAIAINTARPDSSAPKPAAKAFKASLLDADRARAITCLAVAAVYEAGGGQSDQQAVMQVILNRVRHPAYPKTICGVVFQGSERSTGCQFTFTCDGSMLRWKPSAKTLQQAKTLASAMMDYRVDARVGLATHYHTNWVLPAWSPKLDKITSVATHIFLRWNGYWGKPAAFRGRHAGAEPAIPMLSGFDVSHSPATAADEVSPVMPTTSTAPVPQTATASTATTSLARPPVLIRITALQPLNQPGRWALDAVRQCEGKAECRVIGWQDPTQAPVDLTATSLAGSPPDFVYVQILRNRVQQAYWDCRIWPKSATGRCIGSTGDLLNSLGMVAG
ncbi:cell wall hydrolase [Sphingomonas ursincola]|uniref:Cell wall hydrolase n=1 Tax=Sphingomonas ursincola TaxID=56361 RepID=A0A7V8RCF3_9SPHN|nr:cell wall hydrolase [Sphingomonas ursincola]MBA1373902.1 cell wall hydrolase [Sphingomonas ursincola]